MLIGIVAKFRNGPLLAYREKYSFSQREAAEQAGISHQGWNKIECMRFKESSWESIKKVANFLDISTDEICPPELKKLDLRLTKIAYQEVDSHRLEAIRTEERMLLPSPADVVEEQDFQQTLKDKMQEVLKTLTYRERDIIEMSYGLEGRKEHSDVEIGKIFNVGKNRVKQVKDKAFKKLQHPVRSRKIEPLL